MSVLPSPVPHPLEFSPFDVPGWAYEALEWVVGFDWPAGNEVTTWDVADRWYAVATSLAEPTDAALSAAARVMSGYGGAGITADGFEEAWQRGSAPLDDLLEVAHQLGTLVEECGRDLEAAKLEAWIEIGVFLIELIGMTVAVALTLGAASPAAGGLIMATRIAIQRIFQRLVKQLGAKAMKQTAGHALKEITSREGLQRLGRKAVVEGFDEAREEIATNGAIQLYQQTTARADGVRLDDLGQAAAAGFAGGASSTGAGLGSSGNGGGVMRGAGGEVLAEFGSAAVFGDLPDATNLAKAASSGAAGSAMHTAAAIDLGTLGGSPAFSGTPAGADQFSQANPITPTTSTVFSAPFADTPGTPADVIATTSDEPAPSSDGGRSAAERGSIAGPGTAAESAAGSSIGSPSSSDPTLTSPLAASFDPSATSPFASSPDSSVASSPGAHLASSPDSPLPSPPGAPLAFAPDSPLASSLESPLASPPGASLASSLDSPLASPPGASLASSTDSALASSPGVPPASSFDPSVGSPFSSSPDLSSTSAAAPSPGADPVPTMTSSGPTFDAVAGPTSDAPLLAATSPTAFADPVPAPAPISTTSAEQAGLLARLSPGARPATQDTRRPQPGDPDRHPPAVPPVSPDRSPPGAVRQRPLSDLDRIAEALGPRPTRRPQPITLPLDVTTNPAPRIPRQRDPSTASRPTVVAVPLPDNLDTLPQRRPAPTPPPVRDEQAYFGYAEHARFTYELNRRDEYIGFLNSVADENRRKIVDLGHRADEALRTGATLRADGHRRQALELSSINAEIETQTGLIRSGELAPEKIEVDPPDWARINRDVGNLAPGGVHTDDRSAVTGSAGRPPIDRTRRYHTVGGLRPPLAVHQTDLEQAVPRGSDGRPARLPDPRVGRWFRLANDGGPTADPTRGLNCVDGVLALFDTYVHGRPRVSAPRTFDSYARGNPDRPLGGETEGVDRIRRATGSDFQALCPNHRAADPLLTRTAMDLAVRNLTNHLHNTGHGAYAFIITDLEGGGSHSWAAVNHDGTILFLDPQISRVSETPIHHHHGVASPTNTVSMEALVVTAEGTPAPLPHHGPGTWSQTPTGIDEGSAAERQAFASLAAEERIALAASVADAGTVAARVSTQLHAVVREFGDSARVVDEQHRVKSAESLGRKFLEAVETDDIDVADYLAKVKDRVRFSVETAEQNYGTTVSGVLAGLHRLGYRTTQTASFWADHGRHNGLNVWLVDPTGFRLEIQFPTPLSRAVSKQTHDSYEVVRFGRFPAFQRVDAFLHILAINKDHAIDAHRPSDVHLISGARPKTSTLAAWLRSDRRTLEQYKRDLAARGISFQDELRRHGLDPGDVPGCDEIGLLE